jgi:hypothetical protein
VGTRFFANGGGRRHARRTISWKRV